MAELWAAQFFFFLQISMIVLCTLSIRAPERTICTSFPALTIRDIDRELHCWGATILQTCLQTKCAIELVAWRTAVNLTVGAQGTAAVSPFDSPELSELAHEVLHFTIPFTSSIWRCQHIAIHFTQCRRRAGAVTVGGPMLQQQASSGGLKIAMASVVKPSAVLTNNVNKASFKIWGLA